MGIICSYFEDAFYSFTMYECMHVGVAFYQQLKFDAYCCFPYLFGQCVCSRVEKSGALIAFLIHSRLGICLQSSLVLNSC